MTLVRATQSPSAGLPADTELLIPNAMIFRLLPYVLVIAFPLLAIGGIAAMASGFETEATATSIRDIELEEHEKEWVTISDGLLHWEEALEYGKQGAGDEIVGKKDIYVPLVSRDMEWGGASNALVLIEMTEAAAKAIDVEARTYTVTGALDKVAFGNKATKYYEKAGFETIYVLEPGSEPISRGGAAANVVLGVIGFPLAFLWVRRRRRNRAA